MLGYPAAGVYSSSTVADGALMACLPNEQDGRINVLYSTPRVYAEAKKTYNMSWPLHKGDMFPYADCPNCYWTGAPAYESSRGQCGSMPTLNYVVASSYQSHRQSKLISSASVANFFQAH